MGEPISAAVLCEFLIERYLDLFGREHEERTMTHASMDVEARKTAGIGDGLLRMSVGLESERDLRDDLAEALAAIA